MRKPAILILGVIMSMFSFIMPLLANESSDYDFSMGNIKIQVISLTERDLKASILQAETNTQKQKIIASYPNGLIHNSLNILLLQGNDVIALVDTGYTWTFPELCAALNRSGLELSDITHVILTHPHGDHTGGLMQDGKPTFPKAHILFSQKELTYWTNPDLQSSPSEGTRKMFADVNAIIKAYGERVSSFMPGSDICAGLPGVQAVDEEGHTPGHIGILAKSHDRTFFFWSDLIHAFDVQTAFPSVSSSYDMDSKAAARIREQLLNQAQTEGWLVTGSHVPFVHPRQIETEDIK